LYLFATSHGKKDVYTNCTSDEWYIINVMRSADRKNYKSRHT